MRASVLLGAALAGLTVAKPLSRRQDLDFDVIDVSLSWEMKSFEEDEELTIHQ